MNHETKRKESTQNNLCEFSIDARIDDTELPSKIKAKFCSLGIIPSSDMIYRIELSFGTIIYEDSEFYEFPVERNEWQQKSFEKTRPEHKKKCIIYDVLSQQLHDVCNAIKPLNIKYHAATIAGKDFDTCNRVDFCIYEDAPAPKEPPSSNAKKTKRKESNSTVYNIMPDEAATIKNLIKATERLYEHIKKKDSIREAENVQHSPNLISADRIFTALATAILEDFPLKSTTPHSLKTELIAQAYIVSNCPLSIISTKSTTPKEANLDPTSNIDCPEYLIYVKKKNYWTLNKVDGLTEAKQKILSYGYNRKDVDQVIVLHNLESVPFNLFTEINREIVPISKSDAHTAKKLLLCWCNNPSQN